MIRFFAVLAFFASVLMFSCQKDPNVRLDDDQDPASDSLLSRIESVHKAGGNPEDSTSIYFYYDADKKANRVRLTYYDLLSGSVEEVNHYFTRNGAGQITKYVTVDHSRPSPDDSLVYNYFYESGKCTYSVCRKTFSDGSVETDSTIYVYNGSGRIISEDLYIEDGSGSGFDFDSKNEYTYDGAGNILKRTGKYNPGTGLVISDETTYLYDAKINPSAFDIVDWMLIPDEADNPNNVINQANTYAGSTDWFESLYNFSYGNDNKPKTCNYNFVEHSTGSTDTTKSQMWYYYQAP